MKFHSAVLVTALGTSLMLAGCSDEGSAKKESAAASAEKVAAPVAAAKLGPNEGLVTSSVNAGGYTYVEIDQNGKTLWLAGPQSNLQQGSKISWGQGAVMSNFTSKTLNRTFNEIMFVSAFNGAQPAAMPANHPPMQQVAAPSAAPSAANVKNQGTVLSVQNSAGYSYLEVSTPSGNKWVAAPTAPIQTGQTVTWSGASLMRNFTSSSLGKTFDEILFAGSVSAVN